MHIEDQSDSDDVTESDVYEDPAVLYEDAIEDPDPIDLDNYLVRTARELASLAVSCNPLTRRRFHSKSSSRKISSKEKFR